MLLEFAPDSRDGDPSRFPARQSLPLLRLLGLDPEPDEGPCLRASKDLYRQTLLPGVAKDPVQQPEEGGALRRSVEELERRLQYLRGRLDQATPEPGPHAERGHFLVQFDRFLEEWGQWHGADPLSRQEGLAEFCVSDYCAKLAQNFPTPFLVVDADTQVLFLADPGSRQWPGLLEGIALSEQCSLKRQESTWILQTRDPSLRWTMIAHARLDGFLLLDPATDVQES